jgi:hypothetical protein
VPAVVARPIKLESDITRIRGSERLKSNAPSAIVVNASKHANRAADALPLICYGRWWNPAPARRPRVLSSVSSKSDRDQTESVAT